MSTPQPFDPYSYLATQSASNQAAPSEFNPYAYMASGAPASGTTQQSQPSALESDVVRPLGLAGRAIATGAASLPLMAMDAGVATRNLIGDWAEKELGQPASPDYELPSQEFQDALTQAGFPVPQTDIEKGTSFIESLMSGAKSPMPEAGELPGGYQTAAEQAAAQRLRSVRNGMEAGYRVPPSTTNPTLANKGIETIAGKIATQQQASWDNQQITNALAGKALGLDPSVLVTEAAARAVRADAASDYEAIGKVSKIPLDNDFSDAVGGILGRFNSTAEELPTLAKKDLAPIGEELGSKTSISGQAALGAIRSLRDKAETAFRAGSAGEGQAYRQMSQALEDAVDRGLSKSGANSGLVQAFRSARQRIAIAHAVEDAINPGTQNVSARKLGASLAKGEPLSGPLRTIAEFANAVPKAAQEPLTSPVHHLNLGGEMIGAGLGALTHGHPALGAIAGAAAYPAARAASRWFLLNPGQSLALPLEVTSREAPAALRAAPATVESYPELNLAPAQ